MRDQAAHTLQKTAGGLLEMAKAAVGMQRRRLVRKAERILDRLDGGGPSPLEGRRFASLEEMILATSQELTRASAAGNAPLARRLRRDLERSRAVRDRLAKSRMTTGRERAADQS